MEQTVTAKVKIADSSEILNRTMNIYSDAIQFVIDTAWANGIYTKRSIHDSCYNAIRDIFGLQAQLSANVISQAYEILNNRPKSKPNIREYSSIRYNFPRCASIKGDWDKLSISTIDGRVEFTLDIPKCFTEYLDWEVKESNLIKKRGSFYFCFTFSKQVNVEVGGDSQVLGIDLGVNKVAVTSDGDFFGQDIKQKRRRRDELVSELQSKGTRGAIRRLKEFGSSWKRFNDCRNHEISKAIVDKLSEGDVIVMENLKGIRDSASYNDWVHKWSFNDLQRKIEYKATLKGIRVVYISPKNTSKKCSRCGSLHTSRSGSNNGFFRCHSCDYTLDADLNASRNIAHSYTETLGQAGKPVTLPSDTRTADATTPQATGVV